MADFAPNPAGFDALEQLLARAAEKMGEAMRAELDRKISRGSRSGRRYRSYPPGVLASSQDEYPQEVTGNLRSALASRMVGPTTVAVGFIRNLDPATIAQIVGLEYKPPRLGGRKPVRRAMRDPDLHEAARNALRSL